MKLLAPKNCQVPSAEDKNLAECDVDFVPSTSQALS